MSDLAPFVAAAIRDKVVVELKEENDRLRQQLRELRRVEITGTGGSPIYATAQFDEDGAYDVNPNLWEVKLMMMMSSSSMQQQQQQQQDAAPLQCPLADLSNLEIRLGGITRASFDHRVNVFEGYLDQDDDDDEESSKNGTTKKSFNFCFANNFWLTLVVHGWPSEELELDEDDWDPEGEEVMDFFADLAQTDPSPTVSFQGASFFVSQYKSLIDQIPRDECKEQELMELQQKHRFEGLIVAHMRDAGNEEIGAPFRRHKNELEDILSGMNINAPTEEFHDIIDPLIRLQQHYGDDFQSLVNQIIEGLEHIGPEVGFVDIIPEVLRNIEQEEEVEEVSLEEQAEVELGTPQEEEEASVERVEEEADVGL